MLLIMYSREFYARQPAELSRGVGGAQVAHPFHYDPNSWLPWSWQPFLRPQDA
jgi:hypothetical protein